MLRRRSSPLPPRPPPLSRSIVYFALSGSQPPVVCVLRIPYTKPLFLVALFVCLGTRTTLAAHKSPLNINSAKLTFCTAFCIRQTSFKKIDSNGLLTLTRHSNHDHRSSSSASTGLHDDSTYTSYSLTASQVEELRKRGIYDEIVCFIVHHVSGGTTSDVLVVVVTLWSLRRTVSFEPLRSPRSKLLSCHKAIRQSC